MKKIREKCFKCLRKRNMRSRNIKIYMKRRLMR